MEGHDVLVEMPPEIAVEETAHGVLYRFPARRWPSYWAGWTLLLFGIFLLATAAAILVFAPMNTSWPAGVVVLGVCVFIGSGGVLLCIWGQHALNGRAEVELRGDELYTAERTGRLRWTRRRSLTYVKRIHVLHEWQETTAYMLHNPELAAFAIRVVLERDDGTRQLLVKWYARELLEPFARDLSQRLHLKEPVVVRLLDQTSDETDSIQQPEGSSIAIEHTSDGLSIVVPPLGILRSKDGRSVTKLVGGGVAGAVAGVTAMVIFSVGPWWIWAMFSMPALAGVLSVTAGLLGQRDTYLDVVGDTMLISTKSWRGVRQHQWTRDELKSIQPGESVVAINDEKLPQLHIIPKVGDPVHLLTGRRQDEVLWLAHTLRQAMNIKPVEDEDR